MRRALPCSPRTGKRCSSCEARRPSGSPLCGSNTGFSSADGTCREPSISEDALSHQASDGVRVESRKQIGDDYAAVDGYCTTDAGHAASVSKPCTELEVLVGQFVQRF